MNIRYKLYIEIIIITVLLTIIIAITFITSSSINAKIKKASVAGIFVKDLGQYSSVLNDYLLYREERMKQQLSLTDKALKNALEQLETTFYEKDKLFLKALNIHYKQVKKLLKTIEINESKKKNFIKKNKLKEIKIADSIRRHLLAQLSIHLQEMRSTTHKISSQSLKEIYKIQESENLWIPIIITTLILISIGFTLLLTRSISKPLSKLTSGAKEIGEGNFSVKMNLKNNNEIGLLANTFDIMTAKLQEFYFDLGHSNTLLENKVKELNGLKFAVDEHAIVSITDAEGKITYVNNKFCEISQYTIDELLTQDHRIVSSGFHTKDFFKILWNTILEGQVWQGEILNQAKNGTQFWAMTTITPFLDDKGKPYQFVAIRTNITESKSIEKKLKEQMADLEEFNHLFVNQELRIVDLKKEINGLLITLGREPEYKIAE